MRPHASCAAGSAQPANATVLLRALYPHSNLLVTGESACVLDDMRESDNVDDRRGEGGGGGGFGPRLAMGGGGLGLVAVVVVSLLFGVDPRQLLGGGEQVPMQRTQQAGNGCTDADCAFARHVIGSAEDVWKPLLEQKGVRFTPATLTVYDQVTPTACGTGQSSAGPFYCPGDSNIYLDLAFYNELSQRFGAAGDFARAYVIAHEYGHHIQNLMGNMERGEGRRARRDQRFGAHRTAGRLLCRCVDLSRQPAVAHAGDRRCGRRAEGGVRGRRRHPAEGRPGFMSCPTASPTAPAPSACAGSSAGWRRATWRPATRPARFSSPFPAARRHRPCCRR